MREEKIVCRCRNITIGDIKKSVQNGAKTFEDVQRDTGVSASCGRCKEHAKNVAEEYFKTL